MFKILKKRILADNLYLMDIEAPRVAKSAKPGQFVIVKLDEKGERIPLTICDYNANANSVTIVFQTIGESTRRMAKYEEGDFFHDFLGPLGVPSELVNEKMEVLKDRKIVFVAGGVGAAPVYPQVKWLNSKGVKADVIVGAKNKDILILEEEMKEVAGNLYIATDDGSYGYKGLVTEVLKDLVINQGKKYDLVVAIGPMIMMKFVCILTKELDIKTIVSLNPIMVDGTGMCGACRVTVGKEIKFACVDGPEFDGHLVNFDEALRRQTMYKTEEGRIQLKKEEGETHHANGCSCEE
ncbi:sulfide/dihydroorotate dehydrogenase-like FAD/NAD-binding protein [Clostridium paridis]|uniref:Sulfide/dihydroorotate dehydrogenase-like FAD/NAD-binding protein n=1 Tax=Clostridium paridis TaxID=2803863 RepID=A0A937K5S4_9CLOT|nr:sulfide/dihydroorotate dehydrogenase-like FAD/NAD-binding protein [Clostridium paridis]MBL4933374.1 sulfide/dihydroorotate dehydrogenase-like FAD/NAD-binding protein [Clostridium paridis]